MSYFDDMIFLICKLCAGELEVIGNVKSINKKVKCGGCGYCNEEPVPKGPEVMFVRKRIIAE